jgi:hypothetical protein
VCLGGSAAALKRRGGRTRLRLPGTLSSPGLRHGRGGEPREGSHRLEDGAACCGGTGAGSLDIGLRFGRKAPAGWHRQVGTEFGGPWRGTKPMEGSSVAAPATVVWHDGLVSGARPCSQLRSEIRTSATCKPHFGEACGWSMRSAWLRPRAPRPIAFGRRGRPRRTVQGDDVFPRICLISHHFTGASAPALEVAGSRELGVRLRPGAERRAR